MVFVIKDCTIIGGLNQLMKIQLRDNDVNTIDLWKVSTRILHKKLLDSVPRELVVFGARKLNPNLNEGRANELLDALLQWMSCIPYAKAQAGKAMQMIETMDDLWHGFIINTREYDKFCNENFGYFIHHGTVNDPERDRKETAVETYAFLKEVYGDGIHPELEILKTGEVKCCYRY